MKDCPSYFHTVKWARLECKSYKIPEPNLSRAAPAPLKSGKDRRLRARVNPDLVDSIASFTDDDRRFLTAWFRLFPVAPEVLDIAEMICEQGSAASAELDDLFIDATAFDTSCGDPDDPDTVYDLDDDAGDT